MLKCVLYYSFVYIIMFSVSMIVPGQLSSTKLAKPAYNLHMDKIASV